MPANGPSSIKTAIERSATEALAKHPENREERLSHFVAVLAGRVMADDLDLGEAIYSVLGSGKFTVVA